MNEISPFIHLRIHSTYSLLEGAVRIKELVALCKAQGMPAVAITDTCNLFGSLEFSLAAADGGIQPIMGALLFFKPEGENGARHLPQQPDQLALYAQNEAGYRNLLWLVSRSHLEPEGDVAPMLSYGDLQGRSEGLIALTAGPYGAPGRLLLQNRDDTAEAALLKLAELFPNRLYIELHRHGLEIEQRTEKKLIDLALKHNVPLVATNDVYFVEEDMFEAHDALLCIAEGRYISESNRRRLTPEHRFKTAEEMRELFADIPEAIENTSAIAKRCAYRALAHAPILPNFDTGEISEDEALRARAREGLQKRMETLVFTANMSEQEKETIAAPYRARLEYELDVIISMKFPGYFLIVSDFITWSKDHGIPVGPGRGSGAGSVAAWALLITDLDPLRFGLLFERFLNPERVSMPDFDIDFCQERRDEVIHYVQGKYGKDRVAQIITFGKLQARAVLRDVGRVLQIPYGQVDKICKLVPNNPAAPVTLSQAIEMEPLLKASINEDETVAKLVDVALSLEGLNRHASTHAAGVVIGDRPLHELVPLYRDPKSEMLVVQYSMKYAESAGLVKFDFLGLKTLTVLQKAVELVRDRGIELDLLKLPEKDPKTYELLSRGDTLGVFQLESTGMRDTLRRLKPDSLEDIIALVSLYRPGPMDNIPTYIRRKHGEERPEYLHPLLEKALTETFGVIIYQEQVMEIAKLLAGYSLGEADLLRRAMGKKIRSEMEAQRETFTSRAVKNGVKDAIAKSIFDLIAKFAEYGFNKSHAAAYAVIAYQTAYLKANYPVEFFAASMTYDMHNTDKLGMFRQEAAKYGIALLPPDVNRSGVLFTVDEGQIRYALAAVRNVGAQAMQALVAERQKNGPYTSLFDLAGRVDSHMLNRRGLEFLTKAGAFDSLNSNRRQIFDGMDAILSHSQTTSHERATQQGSLFGGADNKVVHLPTLPVADDWGAMDRLNHEFEAIGFYLSSHPLAGYRKTLEKMRISGSAEFSTRLGENYAPIKIAGIVVGKKIKVSARGRFAFVQLSDVHGAFEVSVFNEELLTKSRDLLEPGILLCIAADGKMEESGPRLIAQSISRLDEEALKRPQSEIRIVVDNAEPMLRVKTLIGSTQPQGVRVVVSAPVQNGGSLVDVALPGYYAVTPAVMQELQAVSGIRAVEES